MDSITPNCSPFKYLFDDQDLMDIVSPCQAKGRPIWTGPGQVSAPWFTFWFGGEGAVATILGSAVR